MRGVTIKKGWATLVVEKETRTRKKVCETE